MKKIAVVSATRTEYGLFWFWAQYFIKPGRGTSKVHRAVYSGKVQCCQVVFDVSNGIRRQDARKMYQYNGSIYMISYKKENSYENT